MNVAGMELLGVLPMNIVGGTRIMLSHLFLLPGENILINKLIAHKMGA